MTRRSATKHTGMQEHAENGRAQHAADDAGANGVAGIRARTTRDDHGEHAEDECERRHQNGAEAQPRCLQHSVVQTAAFRPLSDRELDDQNRVFRGQADDGQQADFEEHIIGQAPQKCGDRASQESDGNCHEDGYRNTPTFIQSGEAQVHDQNG